MHAIISHMHLRESVLGLSKKPRFNREKSGGGTSFFAPWEHSTEKLIDDRVASYARSYPWRGKRSYLNVHRLFRLVGLDVKPRDCISPLRRVDHDRPRGSWELGLLQSLRDPVVVRSSYVACIEVRACQTERTILRQSCFGSLLSPRVDFNAIFLTLR